MESFFGKHVDADTVFLTIHLQPHNTTHSTAANVMVRDGILKQYVTVNVCGDHAFFYRLTRLGFAIVRRKHWLSTDSWLGVPIGRYHMIAVSRMARVSGGEAGRVVLYNMYDVYVEYRIDPAFDYGLFSSVIPLTSVYASSQFGGQVPLWEFGRRLTGHFLLSYDPKRGWQPDTMGPYPFRGCRDDLKTKFGHAS